LLVPSKQEYLPTEDDFLDVDSPDKDDPLHMVEYVEEIFENLMVSERFHQHSPRFIEEKQRDVNCKMRAILMDWMVEVCDEYSLAAETLYLSKRLVDKVLSLATVPRKVLQLVGVTTILIASKVEEINPPQIQDLVYICDNTYKREEIISMETQLLAIMKYVLILPTEKIFLRRFLKVGAFGITDSEKVDKLTVLTNYICELTITEYKMCKYLPSTIALASLCVALQALDLPHWTTTIEKYCGYSQSNEVLMHCFYDTLAVWQNINESSLTAIREKYRDPKYLQIETFSVNEKTFSF